MKNIETDVAVIGAGTAGLTARREAERCGARTLLIESGPYGTTCARVGCMPSKLLIAAADAAYEVAHAQRFGVYAEPPRVDGPEVLERVRRERDRFVQVALTLIHAQQDLHARDVEKFILPWGYTERLQVVFN